MGGERVCRKRRGVLHRWTVHWDVRSKNSQASEPEEDCRAHPTGSGRKSQQTRDRKGRVFGEKPTQLDCAGGRAPFTEDKQVEMQPRWQR